MTVEVHIKRWDLVHMNFFVMPRLKYNWFFLGFLFLLYFALIYSFADRSSIVAFLVTGMTAFLIAIAVFVGVTVLLVVMGLFFASESTGLGWHRYEIKNDGLLETTKVNEDFAKWAGFGKVWRNKNFIILQKNWMMYHIFPKRCFASQEDFERFFGALREKLPQ